MTQPDMRPVDSSSVASLGYDEEAQELWVEFVSGGTYVYTPVPETTYMELANADSVGAYINREVKPHYGCRPA